MNIEQTRGYVMKAYSGDRWKQKVMKMTESQIVALYLKMQANKGSLRKESPCMTI